MSYSDPNQNPVQESDIPPTEAVLKLRLNQTLIFSICFTFIVLFVLYVIYLPRRRSALIGLFLECALMVASMAELGLKKEVREMLPIVIFRESFSINDSQCSVCLGDYKADEKLQQIPACGHTFHMDCIDILLTSHTTCPLCRLSLIPKTSLARPHQNLELVSSSNNSDGGVSAQPDPNSIGEVVSHIDDGQEGDSDS